MTSLAASSRVGSLLYWLGWVLAAYAAWMISKSEWTHWKRGSQMSNPNGSITRSKPTSLPILYRLNLAGISDVVGWALPLALGFCLGFLTREVSYIPSVFAHNTNQVHELRNVRIVRDIGNYEYWMQTTETPFFTRFCNDYVPQFSAGQVLTLLRYRDRGNCWSIADTHPAYLIRRNKDGQPITE